jgi:ribosome-interacting GTPase 1
MPTNLPPEYFEIERRYRDAETAEEKAALLEELLGVIPKHKGTEHLRGDYKSRLAKLKNAANAQRSKSRHASAFAIKREGAGQVVLLGAANTGKSSLLAALTNARPQIDPAPYTTWEPMPGMMEVDQVQVQLIDTPPLDGPYLAGELFQIVRRADLIVLLVDLQADPFQQVDDGLRLLEENRIRAAQLLEDQELPERWAAVPVFIAANKCDQPGADQDCEAFKELLEYNLPILPISTTQRRNLERFKRIALDYMHVVRIYAKPPGEEPDLTQPFVVKEGTTLAELGGMIHKDFTQNLKFARVWGSAVRDGQMVAQEYVLQDGDIVELRV